MCPSLSVRSRNEPIGLVIKEQIYSELMILLLKDKLLHDLQDILLDNFRVIAENWFN